MLPRRELKSRARASTRRSYWAAVAVCFILAFVAGEYAESMAAIHGRTDSTGNYTVIQQYRDGRETMTMVPEDGGGTPIGDVIAQLFNTATSGQNWLFKFLAGGLFVVGALELLLFQFFVSAPLQVGGRRFFLVARTNKAEAFELGYSLHRGRYLRTVGTMLLRYLFTGLWTLLLVVPGIIKSYEYRMIPYLLAESPELGPRAIFRRSRELMRGNKWRLFVQDCSFLGWRILSGVTFGLLGVFYVNPYLTATEAEFYVALRQEEVPRYG